ncbi:MAG: DNA polymerase III subunit chi [Pseudomonadota bacterium]
MTRVDFYLLEDHGAAAAQRFACRLCLKALQAGQLTHVHMDNAAAVAQMDELLWNYPNDRFLPHTIATGDADTRNPIHVSDAAPLLEEGLMINLGSEIPAFFGRFDRVAEIVVAEARDAGRERYRHYRERGYPLHHHEIKEWENS